MTIDRDERMRSAAQPGHDLAVDGLPGVRLTCKRCGDAVLCVGGPVYGSATERPCEGAE